MFVEAIFEMYRRRARRTGHMRPQCGAVMFVQSFGGSLNLNVHFHVVLMDGVFTRDDGARVHFHEAEPDPIWWTVGHATRSARAARSYSAGLMSPSAECILC